MIRLIGFCVGCILAVGALLLLVGVPGISPDDRQVDQVRIDAVIENLQRKWKEQEVAGQAVEPPVAETDVSIASTVANPLPGPATVVETTADNAVESNRGPVAEPEWQAIWTPFRTEIAAQGFISRLERVTGLDYRVAKQRAGVYQVSFAYRNEVELDQGMAQIATVTGLDLSADRR